MLAKSTLSPQKEIRKYWNQIDWSKYFLAMLAI
jgi:hypothetical protein